MAKVIGATISFLELVSVLFSLHYDQMPDKNPLPGGAMYSDSRFWVMQFIWRERHVRAACIFSGQEAENEPVSDF